MSGNAEKFTARAPFEKRDLDPNVRQRQASNPHSSVWVNASAGTGKTKVLTDRVLRLLLPRSNGKPGTKAYRILGITFTKAAANEMALRINKTLSRWAILPEDQLKEELKHLNGRPAKREDVLAARQLLSDVIDAPGGLKIMTIHAFCQSILGRFPLEAGLSANFSVLEEDQAKDYMMRAQKRVLGDILSARSSPLAHAFSNISKNLNEQQFQNLLADLSSERYQLQQLLKNNFGIEGLIEKIYQTLNTHPDESVDDIIKKFFQSVHFDPKKIRFISEQLSTSDKKGDTQAYEALLTFSKLNLEKSKINFNQYCNIFLTKEDKPKKNVPSKKIKESNQEVSLFFEQETARALETIEHIKSYNCAKFTSDFLRISRHILDEYEAIKEQKSALDFDDLILKTRALIRGEQKEGIINGAASWVLYKLDQGIEHILVDEAQDTNPDQWTIIESLCDEFFAGDGAHDSERSLFVVGDEKQSIYSFQRASPEEFDRMRQKFAQKIKESSSIWEDLSLNISFRSTKCILDVVDRVFNRKMTQEMLSNKNMEHHSFRTGQEGVVEVWPLCEVENQNSANAWTPPVEIQHVSSSRTKLATKIAENIQKWVSEKEPLPSRGRAVTPGDIMILMRTRTPLVEDITKALKVRNIPVNGVDRMVLNAQLIVKDLLAVIEFALLPQDDLTLACILKSPLIDLSEAELFDLCHERKASLWEKLGATTEHKRIFMYLNTLISQSQILTPYEFMMHVLQTSCPADNISGLRAFQKRLGMDIIDAIDELLSAAIDFSHHNINSLQEFLKWQRGRDDQIKREMDTGNDAVRIMTVHAAKGLQAPIVIMPDTIRTIKSPPGQTSKRLLWPDKSGLPIPLCSPRKAYDCGRFKQGISVVEQRLEEEYIRLMYVAMTRAEDRLYICGHRSTKKPLEESWYHYINSALKDNKNAEILNDGTARHHIPQTRKGDRIDKRCRDY